MVQSSESNGFVRHEIKTYQRKGDQVISEYERLNPDGTVSKTVAYGDSKGLRYRTFHMGLDGTVRELAVDQSAFKTAAPTKTVEKTQPKTEPRKAYAFIVEPKKAEDQGPGSWRVRTLNLNQGPSENASTQSQPSVAPQQKTNPWWYETIKEAMNEGFKEEKPRENPVTQTVERKPPKRTFDWFDDEESLYPTVKNSFFKIPRLFDSFDNFGDSLFERPRLRDFFNIPLLRDF